MSNAAQAYDRIHGPTTVLQRPMQSSLTQDTHIRLMMVVVARSMPPTLILHSPVGLSCRSILLLLGLSKCSRFTRLQTNKIRFYLTIEMFTSMASTSILPSIRTQMGKIRERQHIVFIALGARALSTRLVPAAAMDPHPVPISIVSVAFSLLLILMSFMKWTPSPQWDIPLLPIQYTLLRPSALMLVSTVLINSIPGTHTTSQPPIMSI
jgi:hypothetical protein